MAQRSVLITGVMPAFGEQSVSRVKISRSARWFRFSVGVADADGEQDQSIVDIHVIANGDHDIPRCARMCPNSLRSARSRVTSHLLIVTENLLWITVVIGP